MTDIKEGRDAWGHMKPSTQYRRNRKSRYDEWAVSSARACPSSEDLAPLWALLAGIYNKTNVSVANETITHPPSDEDEDEDTDGFTDGNMNTTNVSSNNTNLAFRNISLSLKELRDAVLVGSTYHPWSQLLAQPTPPPSETASSTRTPSQTRTRTSSRSRTPTQTRTRIQTPTQTRVASRASTQSPSHSVLAHAPTQSQTVTRSRSGTPSHTSTPSRTHTVTPTPTRTRTSTRTLTPTRTRTSSPSHTRLSKPSKLAAVRPVFLDMFDVLGQLPAPPPPASFSLHPADVSDTTKRHKPIGPGAAPDKNLLLPLLTSSEFCAIRILSIESRFTSFSRLLEAARSLSLTPGNPITLSHVVTGIAWIGAFISAKPWDDTLILRDSLGAKIGAALTERLLGPAAIDVLSSGCGCGGLLRSARTSAALSLAGVEPRCRRSLRRYAWALGCADLSAQWAAECFMKRKHGNSEGFSSKFGATLSDTLRFRALPQLVAHGHCANMRDLLNSRCSAFLGHLKFFNALSRRLLPYMFTGETVADFSTRAAPVARFRSVLTRDTNKASNATSAPSVVGLILAGGAGGIAFKSSPQSAINSTSKSSSPVYSLSVIVPVWEGVGGSSQRKNLCMVGAPPSPRQRMAAVALGDGTTIVLFGGRGEKAGGTMERSLQGFSDRLFSPVTFADTFLLIAQPEDGGPAAPGIGYAECA